MRFWDNQIIGNRAGISGTQVLGGDYGGLYVEDIESGGEVDFRRNQILSNTAYLTGTTGGDSGSMYAKLEGGGLLTMVGNTIAGNEAQGRIAGLATELFGGARLVLEENVIRTNHAGVDNIGLYIYGTGDSQYFLRRNQIVGNSAGVRGAGLYLQNVDTLEPLWGVSENNLIADNSSAGVYLHDADFWSTNDTLADNGNYGIVMTGTVASTAHLSNTLVWGHNRSFVRTNVITHTDAFTMVATYSDIEGGWSGTGNIAADPVFVGGGDYHLQSGSPAIDVVPAWMAPATDLDGLPRPYPAGGLADIGAYEWGEQKIYLPLVLRDAP